jgi:uncharacterized OB-fold protein
MSGPLPEIADPEFAPFWEGTASGELRLVFCTKCGTVRWPPRPICAHCQSFEFEWRAVRPEGRLYTWTGVEHKTTAGIDPPYVVGLVTITEHSTIRLLGQVLAANADLTMDMPLVAQFDEVAEGVTLVNWTPAGT